MSTLLEHEQRLTETLEMMTEESYSAGLEDALLQTVKAYTLAAEEKRDRMAHFLLECDERAEMIAHEIERLTERRRVLINATERLKRYVIGVMCEVHARRLEGVGHSLRVVQNPPHVEIEPGAELGVDFIRIIPERREPDRAALQSALKAGMKVPGALLVEGDLRLVVK